MGHPKRERVQKPRPTPPSRKSMLPTSALMIARYLMTERGPRGAPRGKVRRTPRAALGSGAIHSMQVHGRTPFEPRCEGRALCPRDVGPVNSPAGGFET